MSLFSERMGIKQPKSVLQTDSMDADLRNGLWNALTAHYWERVVFPDVPLSISDEMWRLCRSVWQDYFKQPIDSLGNSWRRTHREIRTYFFNCPWYEAYDFIQFIANTPHFSQAVNRAFMESCNDVLKGELSAYRFVGGRIVPITSEEEIAEVEEALTVPDALHSVRTHLKDALGKLADRESPDYRNSIKESISAVEALCQLITGDSSADLGKCLKDVEDKVALHGALKTAFRKLYAYTSDAEGIRHALLEEPTLDFEDAKFMLVACSAFVNYLVTKASKAGIQL